MADNPVFITQPMKQHSHPQSKIYTYQITCVRFSTFMRPEPPTLLQQLSPAKDSYSPPAIQPPETEADGRLARLWPSRSQDAAPQSAGRRRPTAAAGLRSRCAGGLHSRS